MIIELTEFSCYPLSTVVGWEGPSTLTVCTLMLIWTILYINNLYLAQ